MRGYIFIQLFYIIYLWLCDVSPTKEAE